MVKNMREITAQNKLVQFISLILAAIAAFSATAAPPQVGETAPDFTLKTLEGAPVKLRNLTARQAVALIVLRGWLGYQCPLCEKQVNDLVRSAPELEKKGVQLVFVYPGPSKMLSAHAQEFLKNKDWPANFIFLIDPEYKMISAYDQRWNAPNETAYPSTFIVEKNNHIRFAKVSHEHGGRVGAKELIKELDSKR
jgi:peroxiredoxin